MLSAGGIQDVSFQQVTKRSATLAEGSCSFVGLLLAKLASDLPSFTVACQEEAGLLELLSISHLTLLVLG